MYLFLELIEEVSASDGKPEFISIHFKFFTFYQDVESFQILISDVVDVLSLHYS